MDKKAPKKDVSGWNFNGTNFWWTKISEGVFECIEWREVDCFGSRVFLFGVVNLVDYSNQEIDSYLIDAGFLTKQVLSESLEKTQVEGIIANCFIKRLAPFELDVVTVDVDL